MNCPFVYANGQRCVGEITRARAYGRYGRWDGVERQDIRKIRLFCSVKGNHLGSQVPSYGKQRMEFYPDELEKLGLYAAAVALCTTS